MTPNWAPVLFTVPWNLLYMLTDLGVSVQVTLTLFRTGILYFLKEKYYAHMKIECNFSVIWMME